MKCIICKKEFEAVTNKKTCSANCAKIRKAQKDKEFYLKNNKAIKKYKKEWQEKNKDKIKERLHQYYEENKDKIKKRSNKWRKNNLERKKVTNLLWQLNNPDKVKEGRKKYRNKVKNDPQFRLKEKARLHNRRNAPGSHTKEDLEKLFKQQNNCCYWCREELTSYHIDHIIPLSKGGSNNPGNLCISCPSCNLKKGAKMPYEFAGVLF